jgi:hypothetical protein
MDISDILARPHRMNAGHETPFVEGFATELASVGHSALTINGYLGPAIHFGTWLKSRDLDFAVLAMRLLKRLQLIDAYVLEPTNLNAFRGSTRHMFDVSSGIYSNKASSERLRMQRSKPVRP